MGATLRDNERLEFLGDAVLGLAVGEAMFLEASGVAGRRADPGAGPIW